jgi:hypothetical protein
MTRRSKPPVCYEPCGSCPFRTDIPAFLSKTKARSIRDAWARDIHFDCHKTVDYSGDDGEGVSTSRTSICAGFAILAERVDRPTQMMRIAERLRMYDRSKLNMDAPVHKDWSAFIKAQPQ